VVLKYNTIKYCRLNENLESSIVRRSAQTAAEEVVIELLKMKCLPLILLAWNLARLIIPRVDLLILR